MAEKIVRRKKNLFCLKILFIFFYLTNSRIYGHRYRKQRKNNSEYEDKILQIEADSAQQVQSVLDTNEKLQKELVKAKGTIVNVTSIAGSRVHPFAGAAYATSKAALGALTREMANDFGPLGVRVNAIAPGEVKTAILSKGTEKIVSDIPMKRLGLPEEVADTIFYLCSEHASYVSGAEIEINGGQHV